jgi:hypothetical protein
MKKIKLTGKLLEESEDLQLKQETILKTVEWWGNKLKHLCDEFDRLLAEPETPQRDKKLDKVAIQMEELVLIGDMEWENLNDLEARVEKFVKKVYEQQTNKEEPPKRKKKK